MVNETLIMELKNFSAKTNIDCGTLQYDLGHKVDATFKIIVLVLPALMIFNWWAINKIISSGENMERKKFLISFALLFINGVSMMLFFYMIYWIYLSGIDF